MVAMETAMKAGDGDGDGRGDGELTEETMDHRYTQMRGLGWSHH